MVHFGCVYIEDVYSWRSCFNLFCGLYLQRHMGRGLSLGMNTQCNILVCFNVVYWPNQSTNKVAPVEIWLYGVCLSPRRTCSPHEKDASVIPHNASVSGSPGVSGFKVYSRFSTGYLERFSGCRRKLPVNCPAFAAFHRNSVFLCRSSPLPS